MLDGISSMSAEASIVRPTLRALLVPRRLLPILLVSVTMVFAQRAYSRDPRAAFVGIGMCLAFTLVAPVAFRVLFPEGLEFSHGAIRLLIYGALTVLTVLVVGVYLPLAVGIGTTFLTARSSLLIDTVLFLIGGWGLGRDIGMEASLTRERRKTTALTREAEHAQLLALRAQLDPHFLFNTLNAIAEWCRTDGVTAERAVLELASLLRAVLTGVKQPSWPLEQELGLVRTLLSLHLLRDPEMFVLDMRLAPELDHVPIPPMLLVPLAENAVKHGPARGHRGTIVVAVTARDGGVHVSIENPGAYGGPRAGSHGLPITERRLAHAYDGRASLHVRSEAARTIAEVSLPLDGPLVAT